MSQTKQAIKALLEQKNNRRQIKKRNLYQAVKWSKDKKEKVHAKKPVF